jgi:hypothetical protein
MASPSNLESLTRLSLFMEGHMKRTLLLAATMLALAATMLLPTSSPVKASGAQVAPAVKAPKAPRAGAERHPEIRLGLRHLRMAKAALEKGTHDYQGHRVGAIKHVDEAIAECEEALKVDEK